MGEKAALKFLDSMEKRMEDKGICAKCANAAHDGDCRGALVIDAQGTQERRASGERDNRDV